MAYDYEKQQARVSQQGLGVDWENDQVNWDPGYNITQMAGNSLNQYNTGTVNVGGEQVGLKDLPNQQLGLFMDQANQAPAVSEIGTQQANNYSAGLMNNGFTSGTPTVGTEQNRSALLAQGLGQSMSQDVSFGDNARMDNYTRGYDPGTMNANIQRATADPTQQVREVGVSPIQARGAVANALGEAPTSDQMRFGATNYQTGQTLGNTLDIAAGRGSDTVDLGAANTLGSLSTQNIAAADLGGINAGRGIVQGQAAQDIGSNQVFGNQAQGLAGTVAERGQSQPSLIPAMAEGSRARSSEDLAQAAIGNVVNNGIQNSGLYDRTQQTLQNMQSNPILQGQTGLGNQLVSNAAGLDTQSGINQDLIDQAYSYATRDMDEQTAKKTARMQEYMNSLNLGGSSAEIEGLGNIMKEETRAREGVRGQLAIDALQRADQNRLSNLSAQASIYGQLAGLSSQEKIAAIQGSNNLLGTVSGEQLGAANAATQLAGTQRQGQQITGDQTLAANQAGVQNAINSMSALQGAQGVQNQNALANRQLMLDTMGQQANERLQQQQLGIQDLTRQQNAASALAGIEGQRMQNQQAGSQLALQGFGALEDTANRRDQLSLAQNQQASNQALGIAGIQSGLEQSIMGNALQAQMANQSRDQYLYGAEQQRNLAGGQMHLDAMGQFNQRDAAVAASNLGASQAEAAQTLANRQTLADINNQAQQFGLQTNMANEQATLARNQLQADIAAQATQGSVNTANSNFNQALQAGQFANSAQQQGIQNAGLGLEAATNMADRQLQQGLALDDIVRQGILNSQAAALGRGQVLEQSQANTLGAVGMGLDLLGGANYSAGSFGYGG